MRRLVLVVLAVLLALAGCQAAPAARIQTFEPAQRKAAPVLTGELLDGTGAYDPAAHAGNVVVVNFWGSWCGPCVGEAPELEAVYAAHQSEGVVFLGINVRDEIDNARAFAAQYTSYPSVLDPSSRLVLGFEVHPNAIPSTIVLDRQGRIAAIARGPVVRTELDPVVTAILAEAT